MEVHLINYMRLRGKALRLWVLVLVSVALAACSSGDGGIDNVPDEPVTPQPTTYTMTVHASKGASAARTRALSLEGSTLYATWQEGETVTVYDGSSDIGTLRAISNGESTTLKGTLTSAPTVNADLTLKFLSPSYSSQSGTLDYISQNCDYAEATVKVNSVSDGNVTTSSAVFENKQAVVKFTLKDKDGNAAINPTAVNIKYGESTISLTDLSDATYTTNGSGILYVAIPDMSDLPVILTATVGSDTYQYVKNSATFENGKFYAVAVKMVKRKEVSLSGLTEDYVAQSGDVLKGRPSSPHKVSIADGATVVLKDATVTGNSSAGITCVGDATILLEGENEVNGAESYPGLYYPENKTLTILGSGKLTANGGKDGAGIGAGNTEKCGNLEIRGGDITAYAGQSSAGIGSSPNSTCGNILISGGSIVAYGGSTSAAIGCSSFKNCGNITITSGVNKVVAKKDEGAKDYIGKGGSETSCGTVIIDGINNPTSESAFDHFNSTTGDYIWTLTHK